MRGKPPVTRRRRTWGCLGGDIGEAFRGASGSPLFILSVTAGRVLVPDLAGWRRDRMPELPDAAAFELAPD